MPEQIYIGNFSKGLTNNRLPFAINNDAFPTLYNFYSWRGRIKRKRGTQFLGQLAREIQAVASSTPSQPWQYTGFILGNDGSGNGIGNILINSSWNFGTSATVDPGSISFTIPSGGDVYTEPTPVDGTLLKNGSSDPGSTINYASGAIVIAGKAGARITARFTYFPGLPVMGLADFTSSISTAQFPVLLAFDTVYAYQINQVVSPPTFYSVSYYKPTPGFLTPPTNNPVVWSGQDYQLFWTTNYQGALWATNNKPGLHFVFGVYVSGSASMIITFTFTTNSGPITTLIVADTLWFNEWPDGSGLNGITGIVTTVVDATTGTYEVTFIVTITLAATNSGIAQLLNNSIPGQDGIRWYDGDPTGTKGLPTSPSGLGWVNFAPPLTASIFSMDRYIAEKYYLVGALAILPFKDRLLFVSPWIQATNGVQIQMIDTILWSWNGTPYYTVQNLVKPYIPSLVPQFQTADPTAYYMDQTGLGGFEPANIPQPIRTVSNNEDALIVGFGGDGRKTRFVYTGNDISPFIWFSINSELPSGSTFSSIALDRGSLDIGAYGMAMTDQQSSQRFDLDIPDSVFQIQNSNNGALRVNAIRDFTKEFVYFSYPVNTSQWSFPTQTFLFNYRDNTWAIFYENYTVHGNYLQQTKNSWTTIGQKYRSWSNWREPWNSASGSAFYPNIIAGNPQGYVLLIGLGTGEAPSGTIQYISGPLTITGISKAASAVVTANNNLYIGLVVLFSGVLGMTQINGLNGTVTAATPTTFTVNINSIAFTAYTSGGIAQPYIFSTNHCVQSNNPNTESGDYLQFSGALGMSGVNGNISMVTHIFDANNFLTDLFQLFTVSGSYLGLGTFTRLSQPILQTKQFGVYWNEGKSVRLSVQRYLMDYTALGQVTVNIYLSQDPDSIYNNTNFNTPPNSLIYSQLMYTCPESTNLGLTPASSNMLNPSNTNLQMPTAEGQYQIWHRVNTSLIGNSFQIGITLNDAQMRQISLATNEIVLQGMHFTVDRGPQLA